MKFASVITLLAVLSAALLAGLAFAADQQAPDQVTIYNQETIGKMKKGPVQLAHIKHSQEYGVACAECHHVYEDGKNTWKEGDLVHPCSECHKAQKDKNVPKLMNAFHDNCKECHKSEKKGPFKKCEECHGEK